MVYSKNFPEAKTLRERFQHVSTVAEIEDIAGQHLIGSGDATPAPTSQGAVHGTLQPAAC
jgi:hypothetical protein